MPVKDRNPFGEEEAVGADPGGPSPFAKHDTVVECPVCNERTPEKIATRNTPTQILRHCNTCGNEWSCGSVGGLAMTPITEEMRRPHTGSELAAAEPDMPDDFRLRGTEDWFD